MDKYKFGDFIYNQRRKLGITQEELGRKLGVTNKAVSKWETGETTPDIQLLDLLAKTLNVTIDELINQKKPDMILIKPKKWPHFVWAGVCFILICVIVFLSINLIIKNQKPKITLDNATDYYLITPCYFAKADDYSLTINGKIEEKVTIINPNITIELTIQYFYNNSSDNITEILYVGRNFTYTGEIKEFSFTLSPKTQYENFKSFNSFKVNYTIVEVSGKIA